MKQFISRNLFLSALFFICSHSATAQDPYYRDDYRDQDRYDNRVRDRDYERDRNFDRQRDIEGEREDLQRERDRLDLERSRLERERSYQRPPAAVKVESCPSGFTPSEQKCSVEERRRGCKDMRLPGGLGCVHR